MGYGDVLHLFAKKCGTDFKNVPYEGNSNFSYKNTSFRYELVGLLKGAVETPSTVLKSPKFPIKI